MPKSIATEIYWVLPTPAAFVRELTSALTRDRWVRVRLPNAPVPGINSALDKSLSEAHFDNEKAVWLDIDDGMNVSHEIGSHFGGRAMTPPVLAVERGAPSTIVLLSLTDSAASHCNEYLRQFQDACALKPNRGRIRLLLVERKGLHELKAPKPKGPQDLVFSGALEVREIRAYVNIRSASTGPGTIDLLPALIAEFAGFDAAFAEALLALPSESIFGLPDSLSSLLADNEQRWRSGRWSAGCIATVGGEVKRHALYEYYLAHHVGPEQEKAYEALKRRYWRACVRTVLPWLEEHRRAIIDILKAPLEQHLASTGGKALRRLASGVEIETDIDDLEYNRVVGMQRKENMRVPNDPRMQSALRVCAAAKQVRDDLAHLRSPAVRTISELAALMEITLRK